MARATFQQQLLALLRRHCQYKIRTKKSSCQEIICPLLIVILLTLIKFLYDIRMAPDMTDQPIDTFPSHRIKDYQSSPGSVTLFVSPNSMDVKSVIDESLLIWNSTGVNVQYFQNSDDALAAYLTESSHGSNRSMKGINFDVLSQNMSSYTIQIPSPLTVPTDQTFRTSDCGDGEQHADCTVDQYLFSEFVQLQTALDTALIRRFSKQSSFRLPEISVQLLPKQHLPKEKTFPPGFDLVLPFGLLIGYSCFVQFMTLILVTEKENGTKHLMHIMGMRSSAHWISWFIFYAGFVAVITVVAVAILALGRVVPGCNLILLFLLLFLFGMSMICLAFAVTPLFKKAIVASNMVTLVVWVLSLASLIVMKTKTGINEDGPVSDVPGPVQYLLGLISSVSLVLGVDQMIYLELHRGGLNFQTMNLGQFSFFGVLMMLIFDCILYRCIGLYFEHAFNKKSKSMRSVCACFTRSFWRNKFSKRNGVDLIDGSATDEPFANAVDKENLEQNLNAKCEAMTPEMVEKIAIRIRNVLLINRVNKTQKAAIDVLTLDICEGQITALIGHNGAGKTTLIKMLSGLITPTSGTITMYGMDVHNSKDSVQHLRSIQGICPQTNVFFQELTVKENLEFFARLKGVESSVVRNEVNKLMTDLAFVDKADEYAMNLSGGQKRKLCLAISLINDPKVIILDEPTTGMDPINRRVVWSYLQSIRADRVILMTTQHMDEADLLADRKAFVSRGKLICAGSSLFLKTHFGVGYYLSLDLDQAVLPEVQNAMTGLIQKHIPSAVLHSTKGHDLTFMLPITASSKFSDLFQELENLKGCHDVLSDCENSLSIGSFGVSITSLDELFLKIGLEIETEAATALKSSSASKGPASRDGIEMQNLDSSGQSIAVEMLRTGEEKPVPLKPTRCRQIMALMKSRFLSEKRLKAAWIMRSVVPAFVIICAMLFIKSPPTPSLVPSASLSLGTSLYSYMADQPDSYSNPKTLLLTKSPNETKFAAAIEALGIGLGVVSPNLSLVSIAPHYIGLELTEISGDQVTAVTALHNESAIHSMPVAVHLVTAALLKIAAPWTTIKTSSQSWPELPVKFDVAGYMKNANILTLMVGLALLQAAATFADGIIKERQSKCRRQLRVTGVSSLTYWLSRLIADSLLYFMPAVLSLIIFYAFRLKNVMFAGAFLCLVLVYLVCIPQLLLFTYLFSLAFDSHTTAQLVIPNVYFVIGILPFAIIVALMEIFQPVMLFLHYTFLIINPPYGLFIGMYNVLMVYVGAISTLGIDPELSVAYFFAWSSAVTPVLICVLLSAALFLLLLICRDGRMENDCVRLKKCGGCYKSDADTAADRSRLTTDAQMTVLKEEDVEMESKRVEAIDAERKTQQLPPVVLRNVHKKYPHSPASVITNTSFAIEAGEIFGLLGPNGAGKSTMMNIMIAETDATSGTVRVTGHLMSNGSSEAFSQLSYCPQEEPLWILLTVEEHLECYAALRGVEQKNIKAFVDRLMSSLGLEEHRKKCAKKLSGGTARKLTFLLSTLGTQKVALLDEPTAGMDPQSRRLMWDLISRAYIGTPQCCILTTHHIEEADALCSRIAIMVNGQFQCIGSTQHLKSKYGKEYMLEMKAARDWQTTSDSNGGTWLGQLDNSVKEIFAQSDNVKLMEQVGDHVVYRVPHDCFGQLSRVFMHLEQLKSQSVIADYSFSQSTLEQVFLKMARQQKVDTVLTASGTARL